MTYKLRQIFFATVAAAAAVTSPPLMAQDRHADPALEALLPETLGGMVLVRESQSGDELGATNPAFAEFLNTLGRSASDFSVASAYAKGDLKARVGAWRVEGAASPALLPPFQAAIQASSNVALTISDETVGLRTVSRIGVPGQLNGGPLHAFVIGDTIFFVQSTYHALVAEALDELPE